ncbi:hypothetical protein HDV00_010048 [Rhizophlyctis rosea]|nr:hypothetical protein HDV00_010048 [Rhizophlyctis rosea]
METHITTVTSRPPADKPLGPNDSEGAAHKPVSAFEIEDAENGGASGRPPETIQEQDAAEAEDFAGAVVGTSDDPTMPAFTFRVIVLGTFWCIIRGVANTVLSFRTNPFTLTSYFATLLSYPMGLFMVLALPRGGWLNPGPFTIKEHVLITVIAGAGGIAYGTDNVIAQKASNLMGNTSISLLPSLCWVLTTQLLGFGLAGLARRFLVRPAAMLWPSTLSTVALFVGFHERRGEDLLGNWKMSRFKFFWLVFVAAFVWTWVPQYLAIVLQSFSLLCLFGGNKTLRFLASADNGEGVGLGALTIDWYYIGGAVLTMPWWAIANMFGSNLLWAWIITPAVYYSNAIGLQNLTVGRTFADGTPIPVLNSVGLFQHNGTKVSAVSMYNKATFDLDESAYAARAPIYITAMFAMLYAGNFLAVAASVSHVVLWYGKDIKRQFLSAIRQTTHPTDTLDIHNRLMSAYPDLPESYYLTFLVLLFILQILISIFTPFSMPVWAVFLSVGMAALSLLPLGVITAISGTTIGINVVTEFVAGVVMKGRTVSVMAFKSLAQNSMAQAVDLLGDLKLGHYMHIPLYGTVLGAITNVLTTFWTLNNLSHLLGKGTWQMITYQTFYNAGAIWGAIGPLRFFGPGAPYHPLIWCFPIGFLLPFIPWIANKFVYRNKGWHKVNFPLICLFSGLGGLQNGYLVPLVVGWVFGWWVFKRRREWWNKYCFVLAVGLDAGVAVCVLVVTVLAEVGVRGLRWGGNPDLGGGVSINWYCFI